MRKIICAITLSVISSLCFAQESKVDKYANRRFFVLLMSPGENWEPNKPMAQQNLEEHRAYYQRLLEKDLVVIGGGFLEEDGGVSILKVKNKAEADSLVRNDPAVLSGVFTIQVKPMFAVFKGKNNELLDLQGIVFKKKSP